MTSAAAYTEVWVVTARRSATCLTRHGLRLSYRYGVWGGFFGCFFVGFARCLFFIFGTALPSTCCGRYQEMKHCVSVPQIKIE